MWSSVLDTPAVCDVAEYGTSGRCRPESCIRGNDLIEQRLPSASAASYPKHRAKITHSEHIVLFSPIRLHNLLTLNIVRNRIVATKYIANINKLCLISVCFPSLVNRSVGALGVVRRTAGGSGSGRPGGHFLFLRGFFHAGFSDSNHQWWGLADSSVRHEFTEFGRRGGCASSVVSQKRKNHRMRD